MVQISLLQFVDDALFFGEWSEGNKRNLIDILECFHEPSGLKVNLSKSRIIGVGVDDYEVEHMANLVRCSHDVLPFSYLGLPIGKKMYLVDSWKEVIDRFLSRLSSWKTKLLVNWWETHSYQIGTK